MTCKYSLYAMAGTLRKGGYATANVYLLDSTDLLGAAYLPKWNPNIVDRFIDGIMIAWYTLPGLTWVGERDGMKYQGKTLVRMYTCAPVEEDGFVRPVDLY